MMITETHLSPNTAIGIRRFHVFRKDRQSRGVVVAVLVRINLQARQIEIDCQLQVVGVEVEIRDSRARFHSIYIPPKRKPTEAEIKGLLTAPRTIIGEDLNAKKCGLGMPNNQPKWEDTRKSYGKHQRVRGLDPLGAHIDPLRIKKGRHCGPFEKARKLTDEIQKSLAECTMEIPFNRKNHLGRTNEEKEILSLKNKAKRDWNRWRRARYRRKLRELERAVKEIIAEARRRKILKQKGQF